MRLGRVTASCFVSSIASQNKVATGGKGQTGSKVRLGTRAFPQGLRRIGVRRTPVQRTNPQLDGLFAPVLFHHKLVKLRSRTQGGKLLILH